MGMSQDDKPGEVIAFNQLETRIEERQHEKREAKAKELKQRFAAARHTSESKSKAVERLKKRFKKPPSNPR